MCLILLAVDRHPEYALVLAANRDEYYRRPALPAGPWPGNPDIFGGRDLEKGGSWLAVRRGGRFAAVTNFHEPPVVTDLLLSRGLLVRDFLCGTSSPAEYLDEVQREGHLYRGYSLLVGEGSTVGYVSNRGDGGLLGPGVYGISNALLDNPWPKVLRGKQALARVLAASELDPEALFSLLADPSRPDGEWPEDDVPGGAPERRAPIFIRTADYGTRCSTLLLVRHSGAAILHERTFSPDREGWKEVRYELD
jgi:uncharacterized protein with NRDE domain